MVYVFLPHTGYRNDTGHISSMDFLKAEIERKRKQIKATEAAKVVSLFAI